MTVIGVAGCGGSSGSDGGGGSSSPVTVTITEQNGSVSANSQLVQVAVGQKIVFKVSTDVADEVHVHSVPDHEFEIKPGPEQTFSFRVNTPGTVEVESHGLDQTILKLEVH
jgi:plastocyanin